MISPALRHRQAKLAALAAGTAMASAALPEIDDSNPAAGEYRQLLASLHNDLRALHDIQSVDGKIARKRAMITAYHPWVVGALAAGVETDAGPGTAVQDEIVATMLVWTLDLFDWSNALAIAGHMLRHGVTLPQPRYKRDVATFLVDRVADTAKTDPGAVSLDLAREVLELTAGRDMPDQARAKLHRAIGLRLMDEAAAFDPAAENAAAGGKAALVDAALAALTEAVRLDQNVGVKKQVEQLTRDAKKLFEEAAASRAAAEAAVAAQN